MQYLENKYIWGLLSAAIPDALNCIGCYFLLLKMHQICQSFIKDSYRSIRTPFWKPVFPG